jgi:tRNA-modifying protein YgfZ
MTAATGNSATTEGNLSSQWNDLVAGRRSIAGLRDCISAIGPDTTTFLQGQVSQNVQQLTDGSSAWSLLLQPNGRLIALIRLTRRSADEVLIDVEAGIGARVHQALNRFLMRTKCTLTLNEGIVVRRVVTPTSIALSEGVLSCAPWPAIDIFVDHPSVESVAAVDLDVVDPEVALAWNAKFGEPQHDRDLVETTLPSESGLIAAGVAFGKGCYVGQELVERIDSRGRVIKSVCRLYSESSFSIGDELVDNDAVVGSVTSAVPYPLGGSVGMGLVKQAADHKLLRTHTDSHVQVSALIEMSPT